LVFPAEVFGRRKEKMMMRRIVATTTIPFLLSLVLMTVPARAHGNIDPEIRGGLYTEGDGFLGGGLLTGISSTWYFNPNVEVVFADGDYVTVNGDFHKDLNMGEGPAFWLGGGPALVVANTNNSDLSNDPGDSNLDLGLNLLGGVGAKYGSARPFGQLKYMISDQSQFSMALGLRF
jgi:hypothetical protein